MKTKTIILNLLLSVSIFSISCKKEDPPVDNPIVVEESEPVTDIDGNSYKTVKIGNQVWMAENLKTTRYRNGDAIPNVTNDEAWFNLTTGAYCNYDNDPNIAATYGRLYNWFAVNDSRGIAPAGWHVASHEEWITLENFLGGPSIAGGN